MRHSFTRFFLPLVCALLLLFSAFAGTYAEDVVYTSAEGVISAFKYYRQQGITSFSVTCDTITYYSLRAENDAPFWFALRVGGIMDFEDCEITQRGNRYTFSFASVEFFTRYDVCYSVQEFIDKICIYKAAGADEFSLVCTEDVYRQISGMDSDSFWSMMNDCGVKNADVSYGNSFYSFCDVVYLQNQVFCSTPDDVTNAVRTYSCFLCEQFSLTCDKELFQQLVAADDNFLDSVCSACGIYRPNLSYSEQVSSVYFKNPVYYPGYRVYTLYTEGRESELNSEERMLLDRALQIIGGMNRRAAVLEKERYLHDYLCDNVTYYKHNSDGYSIYDTAIGALLYGCADCDGYADAFWLLCSLADIPVRMINGYASDEEERVIRRNSENAHAWNLVSLNEGLSWYMVDVTWDDANSGNISYVYFNMGKSLASQSRVWDEDALCVNWAANENDSISFYGGNFEGRSFSSPESAAKELLRCMNGSKAELQVRINGVYDLDVINSAIWDAIEESDRYGSWSYGCIKYRVVGGFTYATLNAEQK